MAYQSGKRYKIRMKVEGAYNTPPGIGDSFLIRTVDSPGLKEGAADTEAQKAARRSLLVDANRRSFVAECESAGFSPDSPISPSLAAMIRRSRAEAGPVVDQVEASAAGRGDGEDLAELPDSRAAAACSSDVAAAACFR